MKLSTSLVAVKKISCTTARSKYKDEDIEKAASAILSVEGTINPMIVRRTSLQSYEVVEGDFIYYAATRAKEIDPKKGEMVGVYIIEDDNEAEISTQIEIFRQQNTSFETQVNITAETLELFLNNLESRIDKLAHQLLAETKEKYQLESENKELKAKLTQKIEPLEIFNSFEEHRLALKLSQTGMSDTTANNIAAAVIKERQQKLFTSLSDVVERTKRKVGKKQKVQKAISEKNMLKIVDRWLLLDEYR